MTALGLRNHRRYRNARSTYCVRQSVSLTSELWFTWNPLNSSDPIDMLLRGPSPPPDAVVAQVNYQG
jgi:hypothetical protein